MFTNNCCFFDDFVEAGLKYGYGPYPLSHIIMALQFKSYCHSPSIDQKQEQEHGGWEIKFP